MTEHLDFLGETLLKSGAHSIIGYTCTTQISGQDISSILIIAMNVYNYDRQKVLIINKYSPRTTPH